MKLTKAKLIKVVEKKMYSLGYRYLKDSTTGAQGLFAKIVNAQYILTFGLTISRLYDSSFTATFYLSKSTRWGSVWGDIPEESFGRIGKFLSNDKEKEKILDYWWDGDEAGLVDFLSVIPEAEIRFLSQEDIFLQIDKSEEVKEFVEDALLSFSILNQKEMVLKLRDLADSGEKNIPAQLFDIAKDVLQLNRREYINKNTIQNLAADIWYQIQLADLKELEQGKNPEWLS